MAMESSAAVGRDPAAPRVARSRGVVVQGSGLALRLWVLAAMAGLAWWLFDADVALSDEVWFVLMGVVWLGVLAIKGAARV